MLATKPALKERRNYFHYDALLRRFAVEESTGLSYFTWDANGMNLLCERDASGSVTTYYTHGYSPVDGIGTLVAAKKLEAGATYYQYPIYDHRGSVVRLLDENGAPTAYYEYDAWGNVLREDIVGGTGTNRFRANSNYIDLPDSGGVLAWSGARILHRPTGRYLSRDPKAGLAGGYVYCNGDPVNKVDPRGLQYFDPKQCNDPPYWGGHVAEEQKRKCLAIQFKDRPLALQRALNDYFNSRAPNIYPMYKYWSENCKCLCDNYAKWAELMTLSWERTEKSQALRLEREAKKRAGAEAMRRNRGYPEWLRRQTEEYLRYTLNPQVVNALQTIGARKLRTLATIGKIGMALGAAAWALPALGSTYTAAYIGTLARKYPKTTIGIINALIGIIDYATPTPVSTPQGQAVFILAELLKKVYRDMEKIHRDLSWKTKKKTKSTLKPSWGRS